MRCKTWARLLSLCAEPAHLVVTDDIRAQNCDMSRLTGSKVTTFLLYGLFTLGQYIAT